MAPKVAVVTTSTFSAISFGDSVLAISETSSAVKTTAVPFFIFSLISAYVFIFTNRLGLDNTGGGFKSGTRYGIG